MSKVQRKTPTSKTSTVSKIQTGTGHHQLQKKNSAAALIEKQVNEAKLKAEADAAEKVKRETEKLVEEKKKVSHTCCVIVILCMSMREGRREGGREGER